jgi:hypothetical protein
MQLLARLDGALRVRRTVARRGARLLAAGNREDVPGERVHRAVVLHGHVVEQVLHELASEPVRIGITASEQRIHAALHGDRVVGARGDAHE